MLVNHNIKVRLIQNFTSFGYKLYIHPDNKTVICNDGTYNTVEEGQAWPHNAGIDLPDDCLQQIMDELYRYGIRPTKFKDITGELEAKTYHLEDMRRLVFRGKA